jgi:hypothetical protein
VNGLRLAKRHINGSATAGDEMSTPLVERELRASSLEKKERPRAATAADAAGSSRTDATNANAVKAQRNLSSPWLGRLGLLLRRLFLDLPLLAILLVHSGLEWVDYVHHNYLHKQLNAMVFTETRRQAEITYYSRPCDASDITTFNGSDLFLPMDATADEAFDHQLLHGFTVFRNVLGQEDATELRNYIVSKNYNLTEDEKIYVIENDNRFSFGLGTEVPIVAKAMKIIANHPQLRPSIEKIMGSDPALIEMTAITAKYGAVAQYYHDDVRVLRARCVTVNMLTARLRAHALYLC